VKIDQNKEWQEAEGKRLIIISNIGFRI